MPKALKKQITSARKPSASVPGTPAPAKPSATFVDTPVGRQPFVSLCVIFRDNIDTIDNLLNTSRGAFDEYVFVDTGSTDGTAEKIRGFFSTLQPEAKGGPRTRLDSFRWKDDFSAARQASFEAATGRWRMFLDTDDALIGGESLRSLLFKIEKEHPTVQGLFVQYAYAFDEELFTMRLCKWDGDGSPDDPTAAGSRDGVPPGVQGWYWADKIHERLEHHPAIPRSGYGQVDPRTVRVAHKQKSPEEKKAAILRNQKIAEREYAGTVNQKYRARLARTIAMGHKAHERLDEAIPFLEEVQEHYSYYPEGAQAAADLSHVYVAKALAPKEKDRKAEPDRHLLDMAMVWAKRAGPSYEAVVSHVDEDWEATIKAAQRGQGAGQQATHEGAVVEKGGSFLAAAEAVLRLGGPGATERAEYIMAGVHPRWRTHPLVRDFAARLRVEIDRITILVPGTPQPFDEKGGGGMLGGSEEAVMYLSRALAKLGRKVRVFAPLPYHRIPGMDEYGVDWQRSDTFNPDYEIGTLVVWRSFGVIEQLAELRSKRPWDFPAIYKTFMWLHDIGTGYDPKVISDMTGYMNGSVVLSEFHRTGMEQQGVKNPIVLSNGIVASDFEADIGRWEKDPFSVVYSSCPSRGLLRLLEMWPRVKEAVPEAKLDIYYDWTMVKHAQPEFYETLLAAMKSVSGMDVTHHGGVSHDTLHAALKRANVWAYSHFDNPMVETFCISAVKASACGATVLTVPNGALPEVAPLARFEVTPAAYEAALVELLQKPIPVEDRVEAAKLALERFSWETVAKRFSEVWTLKDKPGAQPEEKSSQPSAESATTANS